VIFRNSVKYKEILDLHPYLSRNTKKKDFSYISGYQDRSPFEQSPDFGIFAIVDILFSGQILIGKSYDYDRWMENYSISGLLSTPLLPMQ
jgi:hypothetical protein